MLKLLQAVVYPWCKTVQCYTMVIIKYNHYIDTLKKTLFFTRYFLTKQKL